LLGCSKERNTVTVLCVHTRGYPRPSPRGLGGSRVLVILLTKYHCTMLTSIYRV
jgi:hypothetical protein